MIWDDEMDINLVIEPKVVTKKNVVHNSLRMYVLLTLSLFHCLCETEEIGSVHIERRPQMCHKSAFLLTSFLFTVLCGNRSCVVLPNDSRMLQLGGTANPLKRNKRDQLQHQVALSPKTRHSRGAAMAKLVAKYRDSTFMTNHFMKQKFVKIGESGMAPHCLEENVRSVWRYGLCLLPNGGRDNVLRVSLHLNNTDIQLPFYADLRPLDALYCVVNPAAARLGTAKRGALYKERKGRQLKEALKSGQRKEMKVVLTRKCPRLIQNLTKSGYLQYARERESDDEEESSDTDAELYDPLGL